MKYQTCIDKVEENNVLVQQVKFINTRGQELPDFKEGRGYADLTL